MADKPNPVDVHVGQRLRGARVSAGESQTALGRALGVTFQQVQKYENGTNRLGASRLWQASRFLSVDPDFFFQGLPGYSNDDEPDSSMMEAEIPPLDGDEEINGELPELVRLYYEHPFAVRRAIKALVKSVAGRS